MSPAGLISAHEHHRVVTSHRFCGRFLRCSEGKRVCHVLEVLANVQSGEAEFLIVSFGSSARVGNDCRVLPCEFVEGPDEELRLRCSPEFLRNAPIYVAHSDAMDEDWWKRVRHYYLELSEQP